jgi:uncharacterized protein (DUF2249 family)
LTPVKAAPGAHPYDGAHRDCSESVMAQLEPLLLDVREQLLHGGEPLPRILQAVGALKPGQGLRLRATFEPLPLYAVLGRKGYAHQARQLAPGDWEVEFSPTAQAGGAAGVAGAAGAVGAAGGPAAAAKPSTAGHSNPAISDWPAPRQQLDNRGLMPPEPLVRILAALELLGAGEVLEAINEREPVFLYPELEQRHAQIHTQPQPDGSVRLLIRRGAA